jgi:hypothetical protein
MDNLATHLPDKQNASTSEVIAYRKTCMTRGVTYGGDYSAAAKAKNEVKELVTNAFGLQ